MIRIYEDDDQALIRYHSNLTLMKRSKMVSAVGLEKLHADSNQQTPSQENYEHEQQNSKFLEILKQEEMKKIK